MSRIGSLWSHIADVRETFRAKPDTGMRVCARAVMCHQTCLRASGLIGKSFTNVFHCLWYYIIVGVFGTLLIIAVLVPLCALRCVQVMVYAWLTRACVCQYCCVDIAACAGDCVDAVVHCRCILVWRCVVLCVVRCGCVSVIVTRCA
jgi:hypothetical protein